MTRPAVRRRSSSVALASSRYRSHEQVLLAWSNAANRFVARKSLRGGDRKPRRMESHSRTYEAAALRNGRTRVFSREFRASLAGRSSSRLSDNGGLVPVRLLFDREHSEHGREAFSQPFVVMEDHCAIWILWPSVQREHSQAIG